jgi:Fuc2NAc and GlcNAc transferase
MEILRQTWWLPGGVAAASLVLTALLRRYALRRHLLDVPNARSSHTVPTPRGGGVAIVVSFFAALAVSASGYAGLPLPPTLLWSLIGAGGVVAIIGFVDDHNHIAAHWRLLVHFIAAAAVLFILPEVPNPFTFTLAFTPDSPRPLSGILLALLACGEVLYLVWVLNLYNFMDGIDGIAGTEAICVCLGGALLFLLRGDIQDIRLAVVALLLAAAALGFLYWNWSPARIFMGDAGSGFLGFALGVLSLYATLQAPVLFWSWAILLAVFICDASLTLARRAFARQRVHEAHRSHAYQHAAQRRGHRPVTLAVGAINIFWLLPLALAVGLDRLHPAIGILAAYAPLTVAALKLNAGKNNAA